MADDRLVALEAEYCPPLDPALLSAILSDYDLSETSQLQDARTTLDALKETALLEEEAGFDPSGTGALDDSPGDGTNRASGTDTARSTSHETGLTDLSNDLSSLDLNVLPRDPPTAQELADLAEIEKLSEDAKVELLKDVLGDKVKMFTIKHTLKKCNGRWSKALDELLNHVYFGEAADTDGSVSRITKGIDGFSEDNVARRGRKGKAKNKNLRASDEARSSSHSASMSAEGAQASNRWKSATEDIDFIATRMGIPSKQVASVYYEQQASVPQTIGKLVKMSMSETPHVVGDDVAIDRHARELKDDFPTLTPDYCAALIRLTHPSTTTAHELAKALTTKPKQSTVGGIHLIPQYARPAGIDDASDKPSFRGSKVAKPNGSVHTDPALAASRIEAYERAKSQAFESASAAHRRARANNYLGGAAAYYSQVARDNIAQLAREKASAMDDLAAAQSGPGTLDLHGFDVLNAVRTASNYVHTWWQSKGESRVNGRVGAVDRSTGYRIVVGAGRHSGGGKSVLGPAVSKALREEGWRVENEGAVLVVYGPARR